MAELKTKPTPASVSAFLDSVQPEARRRDAVALARMMAQISGETPVMWGATMVGFGVYHYIYGSGHSGSYFMTGFAPRKAGLVIYIMPGFAEAGPLLARLGKHRTSKSCLTVNRLADVDQRVLEELVRAGWRWMRERYPTPG